jgi:hypothetical protein
MSSSQTAAMGVINVPVTWVSGGALCTCTTHGMAPMATPQRALVLTASDHAAFEDVHLV